MTDNSALKKVETPLMERYVTVCHECQWDRHFFGTATEARASAEKMGWEFREVSLPPRTFTVGPVPCIHTNPTKEIALCPHCRLLVKPWTSPAGST